MGQAFDVRGRLKPVGANLKHRQHGADAVGHDTDAAGPPDTDICERLGVDLHQLQRRPDLFRRWLLMARERPEYESELREEILSMEHRLDG